jgi:hypothetical protein
LGRIDASMKGLPVVQMPGCRVVARFSVINASCHLGSDDVRAVACVWVDQHIGLVDVPSYPP